MIALVVVAVLIFARLAGLLMTMPGFSSQLVPALARLAAAVPLTAVLYPVATNAIVPETVSGLVVAVLGEVLVGVAMGFAISVVFGTLTMGAEMISAQSGLQMAMLLDPMTMSSPSAVSVLATWLGTGVFFGADLHLACIAALAESLGASPPGSFGLVFQQATVLIPTMGAVLSTAVQLAGPITIFVFTVNLGLSLVGRMAPNLQLFFALGPTITVVAALGILAAALPAMLTAWYSFLPLGFAAMRTLSGG